MAQQNQKIVMDFSMPDTTQAVHPIVRKIEFQVNSLKNLLHFNSGYFQSELGKLEKWKDEEIASVYDAMEDELEIVRNNEESKVIWQYETEKEFIENMRNDFFHAAFILAYSYFESMVTAMCIEKNKDEKDGQKKIKISYQVWDNIKALLDTANGKFKSETQKVNEYIIGDLKNVRNLLTHNYNGTTKEEQLLSAHKEEAKGAGIRIYSNDCFVIELPYVEQAIDKEYQVLTELATILQF